MFTIDQEKMERLVVAGLKDELASAMRSQWGTGQKLRQMVDNTISFHQNDIQAQIVVAVKAAINSPEFVEMARQSMLLAMKDKFSGAFEGVMRAAGKRAAQDELAVKQLAAAIMEGNPS
jgi:Asp-tRNA(Asn)/Glu-tRNA(Gln) amidotransferase B subunit